MNVEPQFYLGIYLVHILSARTRASRGFKNELAVEICFQSVLKLGLILFVIGLAI